MANTQQDSIKTIDPATVKQLWEQNQVKLIDVREIGEYSAEHIEGADLMSLSRFNPEEISPDNQPIILCCQTGSRSNQAAEKLLKAGFTEVNHLQGGLNQWKQLGYPTKINKNAPISIMRQVQIVAGFLVFSGVVLGKLVSPYFFILSGFVGAGLMFAGISGTCAMAKLLMKLPYNKVS
jgi:rhodanese-related sulfurtransferase